MFNAQYRQCSTQAWPRRQHGDLIPGHREMAAVVEILDVANRPELGRRGAVVPRHVPDVVSHGTVGAHPLPLGLELLVVRFVVSMFFCVGAPTCAYR